MIDSENVETLLGIGVLEKVGLTANSYLKKGNCFTCKIMHVLLTELATAPPLLVIPVEPPPQPPSSVKEVMQFTWWKGTRFTESAQSTD